MNDNELTDLWTTFEPVASQRQRISRRLFAYLEAHDTSLADEWLTLIRVSPLKTLAMAAVSAVAVGVMPLLWAAALL